MAGQHLSAISAGGDSSDYAVTNAVEANAALPTNSEGETRFIYVTATVATYLTFGSGSATAVAGSSILLPAFGQLTINAAGHDWVSHIGVSASGILNITPLANQ